jgi:hypothetical protein
MCSFANALANAIANAEGYGVPGAIPTVANNPGSLAIGDIGYGTMGSAGITVFPTLADGQAALNSQVNSILSGNSSYYSPDQTISQIGQTYSGSSNGNWANNVAKYLGVTPSTTLTQAQAQAQVSSALSGLWAGLTGSIPNPLSGNSNYLEDIVLIVVGVVLVGAGLFAFKGTQTVVETVGRTARRASEIASA